MDILLISRWNITDRKKLMISRGIAFMWACVMMGIAMLIKDTKSPLVELGLGIASITYGGMLGIFLQGALFHKFSDRAALTGVMASIAAVLFISTAFNVFWPWFVPIGFTVSFAVGSAMNAVLKNRG